MRYFVSAGEASGDLHASALMGELRGGDPKAEFTFLGGDMMASAASAEPLIHYRQMAFMGYGEVLRHLPQEIANLKKAKEAISKERPDAVVLVDYPTFNLKLAKHAKALGIPVYYYISPKVWAWKGHRLGQIRSNVRRMFSIFPFEEEFYRARGFEAAYVGNPSVAEVARRIEALPRRGEFLAMHRLPDKPIIALVPGSRRGEIRANLPVMVEASTDYLDYYPVVAAAPGIDRGVYRQITSLPIVADATFGLLRYSAAALVTSGTATLEAALSGTPQVVCYRANGSALSYSLFKRILKVRFVSLPNLIAGGEIVPEMLLHHCTASAVAERLERILTDGPEREAQLSGYDLVRRRLGDHDAAANAASGILSDLKQSQTTL